ncbi:hypothetical protein BDV39DRAFT_167243 [Aspergillus sergii]|uniref:Uncharacterized protein n=1 Tax=Aspergillus sergii TaxID=1034303 RepID=A0A5N6XLZ2_9EURO|nr:hypothetical protein BDV39DRAFT_167243 [Aspergillus sergii]
MAAITSQQHDTITLYPTIPHNYATINDGYNSVAGEGNGVISCYDYHQDREVVVSVALLSDMSIVIDCTSCPCRSVPNPVSICIES